MSQVADQGDLYISTTIIQFITFNLLFLFLQILGLKMTINHKHFGVSGGRAFLYKAVLLDDFIFYFFWGTCSIAARVGALCASKDLQVVGL